MVVKNVIKWRPWLLMSKKYKVKLVVMRMEGCDRVHADTGGVVVEIRWKGSKISLTSFRKTVKRNFTKEVEELNGVVLWDEVFSTVVTLSGNVNKENNVLFNPWEIGFTVLNGLSPGPKNKVPVIGTASLNLAEFASAAEEKELDLAIPVSISNGATEPHPSLHIQLSLTELKADQEPAEPIQNHISESSSGEKDELSALKAGLRKVKIFTEYVSTRRGKKTSREDDHDTRSEGDYSYHFDSSSLEESEEGESNEVKEDNSATFWKSFGYGTLAYANCNTGSLYEDGVYYSYRKSDVGCSQSVDDSTASISEPYVIQNTKRGIFPWKKRKLNLRSPKSRGEPLLKKAYAEEGGDDIDFDRRQSLWKYKVKLVVMRMEGCDRVHADTGGVVVEIRWKGSKISLTSFRKTIKRNFTKEVEELNGVVLWDEVFSTVVTLSGNVNKENNVLFNPWEIGFTVLN
nr:hypothetical protein [Tanacetum cinerariifolium]